MIKQWTLYYLQGASVSIPHDPPQATFLSAMLDQFDRLPFHVHLSIFSVGFSCHIQVRLLVIFEDQLDRDADPMALKQLGNHYNDSSLLLQQ